jgi:hypothetical protein
MATIASPEIGEAQSLSGGNVLPGFELPLRELFAKVEPWPKQEIGRHSWTDGKIAMRDDSILREIWRIKDANAAKYGFDVRAIGKALQAEQRRSGRKMVSRPAKGAKVAASTPGRKLRIGSRPPQET